MMQILLYLFAIGILIFILMDFYLFFWIYKSRKDWAVTFAIWGQRNEGGNIKLSVSQQKLLNAINILKPIALTGILLVAAINILIIH